MWLAEELMCALFYVRKLNLNQQQNLIRIDLHCYHSDCPGLHNRQSPYLYSLKINTNPSQASKLEYKVLLGHKLVASKTGSWWQYSLTNGDRLKVKISLDRMIGNECRRYFSFASRALPRYPSYYVAYHRIRSQ